MTLRICKRILVPPALAAALVLAGTHAADAQRINPLTKSQAIQATIEALGANGSAKARKALRDLVSGAIDMKTYDKFAAVAALNVIARNSDKDDEQFLVKAVVEPDAIRPIGRGIYTARELQQDAARLIEKQGSIPVRTALAEYITTKVVSAETKRSVDWILRINSPANIPAKAVIYASPNSDARAAAPLALLLLQHNQRTMEALLRIPQVKTNQTIRRSPKAIGADDRKDGVDETETGLTVKALWNEAFVKAVVTRTAADRFVNRQTIPLLASIPIRAARRELLEHLKKNANSTPTAATGFYLQNVEPFDTTQRALFASDWDDPGALLVLKSIPRSQPPAVKVPVKPIRRRPRAYSSNPKHQWFDAVSQGVAAWSERAFLASIAADKAGRKPLEKSTDGWLIPPHAGAVLSGWQRVKFPDTSQKFPKGVNVPPLALEYYRVEGVVDYSKIRAHYQKAVAEKCKDRPQVRRFPYLLWLDGAVETLPDKRRRSVDVVLKRLAPTIGSKGGEMPERVRVEVLVIETEDFRERSTANSASAESSPKRPSK